MSKQKHSSTESIALRKKAEIQTKNRQSSTPLKSDGMITLLRELEANQAMLDIQNTELRVMDSKMTLLHELEVHKVELEMQNEELRRARVEMEEALKRQEFLYNYSPAGYFTLDYSGTICELNTSGAIMLDKERYCLINFKFGNFIASENLQIFSDFLHLTFETCKKQTCEVKLITKATTFTFLHLEGIVAEEEQKCFITAFDYTDRMHEAELKKYSEEKFQSLIDNLHDVYYEAEIDGKILEISPSIDLFSKGQYKREEVIGRSIYDFYKNGKDRDVFISIIKAQGSVTDFEMNLRNKDGSFVPCAISSKLKHNLNDGTTKITGTIRDITERKKAEEAIEQHNRDLKFINCFALGLNELPLNESVENFMVQQIKEYTGTTLLSYSQYNSKEKVLQTRFIESDKNIINKAIQFAGKNIKNLVSPVNDDALKLLISRSIFKSGSFNEVSFGAIPEVVDKAFRSISQIDRIFGISIKIQEELYGAILLCFKEGVQAPSDELMESFAHLSAVVLQRRKAEDALRESEIFFKDSQRVANIGSYKIDFSTGLWESSKVFDSIFGIDNSYRRDTSGWIYLIHPEEREEIGRLWNEEVISKNGFLNMEYRIIRKSDGEIRWLLFLGEVVSVAGNEKKWLYGTVQDITERMLSEQAIRESEQKYRKLHESMVQGVVYINAEGRIFSANPSACRIFGLEQEELQEWISYRAKRITIHEDGSPFSGDTLPAMISLKTGRESSAVVGIVDSISGSVIWVNVFATPEFRTGEEKPYQVFTTIEDITKLKQSHQELKLINQQLEERVEQRTREIRQFANLQHAILDNAGLSIISADTNWVVQTFNSAAERMLGYTTDEVIGKVTTDFFHDPEELARNASALSVLTNDNVQADYSVFSAIHKEMPNNSIEWNYVRKDGTKFPVKLSISSFDDTEGNIAGYIGVSMDITREKKAMEDLLESEERFHQMFHNHSAVMLLVHPASGQIIEANLAAEKYYGYNFLGSEKININNINALSREQIALEMAEASIQKRNYFIFPHILASGKMRTVEVHSTPIEVNGEKLLFSVIHDITERALAEELLRKSEAENRAILAAVPDLLFRLDKNGTFLAYHTGNPDTLLIQPEEFIGKELENVLPPHIASMAKGALNLAIETQKTQTLDYDLSISGEVRYFENRILGISDGEALSIIRDITDRKNTEKALQWNESLLKKMTESSPLAFLVVDNRSDEILYSNHQFCEIWGIEHLEERIRNKELKNNDIISDCLPVLKDIPAFAQSYTPLQYEFNRVVLEDEIPFNDGRTIRRFTAQIRDDEDQYYGRLYIFEDITHRKSIEDFLQIQRDLAIGLSAISDIEEALGLSLESVLRIGNIDAGGIWLFDDDISAFKLKVQHGLSDDFIEAISEISTEFPMAKLVLAGKPIYGPFNQTVLQYFPSLTLSEFLCLALIPIEYEGRVIGSFNLASKTTNDLYNNVHASIEVLALQVGSAISRINAEKALRNSQQNFRTLFDTIDDFMFILDTGGNIKITNPIVQKRLGYSKEELQAMNVLAVHPPERREEAGFIVGEMLAGKASYCPVPLCAKDGTIIPVETRVVLGKWDNEDVLYGISRDVTKRQKAENELQLRESYLSAVISNHPGMFWMKDKNGKFLLMNDHNDNFLSSSSLTDIQSVIGKTDFDFMPIDDAERYLIEDQQVMLSRSPLVVEEQKTIDNELIWYEKYKFPVVDKAGDIIGVSAYSIDITQRKITESALKLQSAAFESFTFPIIITDKKGKIQWTNSSFIDHSGYTVTEAIGRTPGELIKSGLQDKEFYKNLWQTILSGKVWSGELVNRRKNGSLHPEELTITPVRNHTGEISNFIAIKIDITSRNAMKLALLESEARWNFALEGSGDGVWDWNVQTSELFVSRQWKAMFGYSDSEVGKTLEEWEKRVHPDDIKKCFEELEKHFNGVCEVYLFEYRILCKDGTFKWVLDRGKTVEWTKEGNPLRVIGIVTDISDRKLFEQSLQQSIEQEKELNDLKSKFISVASHEFRTPLATIQATSDSLATYWEMMDEQQREVRFAKINTQVTHLNKYIEDMLTLTKLQAKEKSLEPEIFDLVELSNEIIDEFRNMPENAERLEFKTVQSSIIVFLGKTEIKKIVTNLVNNALKYSDSLKQVRIKITLEKETVVLAIKDLGIGIPDEDLKHLFTPFFRASNTGNITGTGLGLNIVKESVERHKGKLFVKSQLNVGSEFIVSLPLSIEHLFINS
jgi:PAS domain S-box-containing protein